MSSFAHSSRADCSDLRRAFTSLSKACDNVLEVRMVDAKDSSLPCFASCSRTVFFSDRGTPPLGLWVSTIA